MASPGFSAWATTKSLTCYSARRPRESGEVELKGRRLLDLTPGERDAGRHGVPARRSATAERVPKATLIENVSMTSDGVTWAARVCAMPGTVRGPFALAAIRRATSRARPASRDAERRQSAEGVARQVAADPTFPAPAARTDPGRRYRVAQADPADHRGGRGGGNGRRHRLRGIRGAREPLPPRARLPPRPGGPGTCRAISSPKPASPSSASWHDEQSAQGWTSADRRDRRIR